VVLALSLAGFSGALAVQSTVLDADYVADTVTREGAYGGTERVVTDRATEAVRASLGGRVVLPGGDGPEVLAGAVERAVTTGYVRSQTLQNLQRVYDFLHGRSYRLRLGVETDPLATALPDAVAAEVREMPLAAFVRQSSVGTSLGGLDAERLGETVTDRTAFAETQAAVGRRLEASGRDRDDLNRSLREATDLGDVPPAVERSVYDLQGTVVVAMSTDTSHGTYVARLERRRAALARAVGEFARREFERAVGSRIDLTGQVGPGSERRLQQGRRLAGRVGTLLAAFPFLALATLGVLLGRTRSVDRTVRLLGAGLVAAGVAGFIAGLLGRDWAVEAVRASTVGGEAFVTATAAAVVDGLFGRLVGQSATLLVVGGVILGVSYALSRTGP
jgi:hypothetical protein